MPCDSQCALALPRGLPVARKLVLLPVYSNGTGQSTHHRSLNNDVVIHSQETGRIMIPVGNPQRQVVMASSQNNIFIYTYMYPNKQVLSSCILALIFRILNPLYATDSFHSIRYDKPD